MKLRLHTLIPLVKCEIIKEYPNSLPLGTIFELKRVFTDNKMSSESFDIFIPQEWSNTDSNWIEKTIYENSPHVLSKLEVLNQTEYFKVISSWDSFKENSTKVEYVKDANTTEKIESPNFSILTFYDRKEDYMFNEVGKDLYVPITDIDFSCGLDYCLKHFEIKDVLRLSDKILFTIGCFVRNKNKERSHAAIHKIESFSVKRKQKNRDEFFGPQCIWVTYDKNGGGHWLDELELVNVIIETEDNFRLCVDDYVYRLVMGIHGNSNVIFKECILTKDFKKVKGSLYFGDETSAKLYASLNTVKYSEQDILDACEDNLTITQKIALGTDCFKRVIDLSKLNK